MLKRAAGHLAKHGSDSSRLDSELLLAHSLGLRRLDLYLQYDRPLSEAELSGYRTLVARRARGEPVAYVIGHKEFMGLDLEVSPAVLVPNPDTELLVQRGVAIARDAAGPIAAADVGTGSGCIAIALAHFAPAVEVWAGDVSQAALEVAARNVTRLGLTQRIHLSCGDLLESLPGSFDLICANLPYLTAGAALPPEVMAQPRSALFAGGDGQELVVRLFEEAAARLRPGGRVLAEVDPSILPAVLAVAGRRFGMHRVHRDLGGHERLLEAWS